MALKVYLSGEIHTDWRDQIKQKSGELDLDVIFHEPVTDHERSDDCGERIMGPEEKKFWHDQKSAKLNAMRTRRGIDISDVVIVRFGEKYRQWNAAFDAGYASARNKSIVVIHSNENQHALKEVDAAASAVVSDIDQAVKILQYIIKG